MSRSADPKCTHARKGIVTAGGRSTGHAATNVCADPACIADAMEWAEEATGEWASHVPDASPRPSDRLTGTT